MNPFENRKTFLEYLVKNGCEGLSCRGYQHGINYGYLCPFITNDDYLELGCKLHITIGESQSERLINASKLKLEEMAKLAYIEQL